MADSTLVISDRTPLLERRESMSSADGNFRAFDDREKELRDLENMYDISQNVQIENVIPIDLNVVQMECPPELISANIMCIFAVAFDNRAGNVIEWHLPKDCNIEGIEFRAMASGLHKVQTDFIYFKRAGLYGLACFENMPLENDVERGARMKSLGVLSASFASLHQHMDFLQQHVRLLLQQPGSYAALEQYYGENKYVDSVGSGVSHADENASALKPDALFLPLMKITHPAGCFSQFMKFFSENVFALWKMILLKKRIIFFSPPPIGVVCYRVYCAMCLAAHRIPEIGLPDVQPLFYINIADLDHLEHEKSYIACTTEKIFESKTSLYDLYVNNQNLCSDIPILQKLLEISPALKMKYAQLCLLQSQMSESSQWDARRSLDESWFVRYFMSLNEHLFTRLLSVSHTQDKLWTEDHMLAVGLDPVHDRLFIMELADMYGIDIIIMIDKACCHA